jgi:biotin carboxylase
VALVTCSATNKQYCLSPQYPRRILLLAAATTYRTHPFVVAAERLGLEVIQGKDIPLPWLAKVGAADAALPLDYRDLRKSAKAIVRFAAERPVGAILGLDDSASLLAAKASEVLGLPHNSPESAAAARDKYLMRRCFALAGVPSPAFHLYQATDDPAALAAQVSYPCVLKPTILAGSRGVMRADNPIEFVQRFERLRRILATEGCNDLLVEEFIPGMEVALEGILDKGRLKPLALFDKPDPLDGPFFEETIYVTPSRLPAESQAAILEATTQAAAALGLRHGPIHAELRFNKRGPWLVEVAARSIGGLCSQTLRFGTDMSLEELILRQAFGLEIESLQRDGQAGGVMMIPIPEAGLLKEVTGIEEAAAVPLIENVEITAPLNYPVVPLPEGNSYLGFIFARGPNPAAVEAALRKAHGHLNFDIAPQLPLVR